MERRKFIQKAGIAGLSFSDLMRLLSCTKNESNSEEELKQQVMLGFQRFEGVWNFSDFRNWRNAFNTCLVFANAVQQSWPDVPLVKEMDEKIVKMLAKSFAFFESINFGVVWADDFGWRGLMVLNIRKILLELGEVELADKYWILANDLCWKYKKDAVCHHMPHVCRNGDTNGQSMGVKIRLQMCYYSYYQHEFTGLHNKSNAPPQTNVLTWLPRQWIWFSERFKLE